MKTLTQIREASGGKEAYQKFFNSLLKKFGVDSPSELEGKKKKDFFDAIDKGWDGDNEKAESTVKEAKLKGGRGKAEIDINWDGDRKDIKFASTKYKIKIKPHAHGAMVSGDKQKILAYLQGQDYAMDDGDIEDLYPEILENKDDFKDDTDVDDDKGNYSGVDEEAPPGMEDVVKKLKADGNSDEEAFAIAWSAYNSKKRRERNNYNEAARIPTKLYNQVLRIAMHNSGDMEKAIKQIERLKKGLSDHKDVMNILKIANEGVAVDRRTVGFKAAMIRSEKSKKVREKSKIKKEKKKEQEVLDARYEYDGEVDTILAAANKSIFGETAANAAGAGSGVDMAPNARNKKKDKFKVVKRANY
jgi:hypothetical protein